MWIVAVLVIPSAAAPILAQDPEVLAEDEVSLPDVDLAVRLPARVASGPDGLARVTAEIVLSSRPVTNGPSESVRAWSLSIAVKGGHVDRATTRDTDVPRFVFLEGYEKTELASSSGSEGVVSAVILSLVSDARLPLSQDSVVLRFDFVAEAPADGCAEVRVDFVDGLLGSGQPVQNVVTCGEGITRRDDGGESDHDDDGYESGRVEVCKSVRFIRGNLNGDRKTNVSDGLALLAFLFGGAEPPRCEEAADVNGDHAINVTDVVYLLEFLFQGGPPPSSPHPSCGVAEGPNVFPCQATDGCD